MDDLNEKVESLLLKVAGKNCDPETFLDVRDQLVQMVIVSVSPPSCKKELTTLKDDEELSWSERKEMWIAR